MLSYPQYWWKRHTLTKQLRATYKASDRAVAKAKAAGASQQQIYDLGYEHAEESWLIEDELQQLESRYLCLLAHKYRIPIPSHDDQDLWETSGRIGGWQLTEKGYAVLRADIRKEQNDRWQWWELRTKVVIAVATALTGLIGALIGWVALVKH